LRLLLSSPLLLPCSQVLFSSFFFLSLPLLERGSCEDAGELASLWLGSTMTEARAAGLKMPRRGLMAERSVRAEMAKLMDHGFGYGYLESVIFVAGST
jgi:hypothetical protein